MSANESADDTPEEQGDDDRDQVLVVEAIDEVIHGWNLSKCCADGETKLVE